MKNSKSNKAAYNKLNNLKQKFNTIVITLSIIFMGIATSSVVKAETWCTGMQILQPIVISDCCIEITITGPYQQVHPVGINVKQYDMNNQVYGPNIPNYAPDPISDPVTIVEFDGRIYYFHEGIHILHPGELYKTIKLCAAPGENRVYYWVSVEYSTGNGVGYGDCPFATGIVQLPNCCNCPPPADSWLTLNVENDSDCGPGKCKIVPVLTIPEDITCFDGYLAMVEYSDGDYEDLWDGIAPTPIENNLPSVCVNNGETITYYVGLTAPVYQDWDIFCNLIVTSPVCVVPTEEEDEPIPGACVPDCHNTPFVSSKMETLMFELIDVCPGCFVTVTYCWRDACDYWQDIQILEMVFDEDSPCANCDIEKVYENVLTGIIALSNRPEPAPDFEPKESPDCSTIWRVANAGCWKERKWYQIDLTGVYKEVIIWTPCDYNGMACCLQQMRVCRSNATHVDIQPIGSSTPYGQCPESACTPACAWAGLINGVYTIPVQVSTGELGKLVFDATSNYLNDINAYHTNDILNISFVANEPGTYTLNMFTSSGILINTYNYKVLKGSNTIMFNTLSYNSGVYFYTLTTETNTLFMDKFIIAR